MTVCEDVVMYQPTGGNLSEIIQRYAQPSSVSPTDTRGISTILKNLLVGGASVLLGTSVAVAQPVMPHVGTSTGLNDNRPAFIGSVASGEESMRHGLSYEFILTMSIVDQAREVMAALAINKSQLAEILRVSRPTLYSWFDGSNPSPENSDRLMTLLRLMAKTQIQGNRPLNSRFVRQPLTENGHSLIEYLKNERWDETNILGLLEKAKVLSAKITQIREARNKHLRDLGYEEPSAAERKDLLAQNIAMMEWDERK